MLAAHGIVNQNVSRVPGTQHLLGNTELPETGAFDFLNYLLGLQVNSGNGQNGQEELFTVQGSKSENTEIENPLQTLFQKKEQPLWNPLVPTGAPTSPNLNPLNLNGLGKGETKTDVPSETQGKNSATQAKAPLLENRLVETQTFLETRGLGEKGTKSLDSKEDEALNGLASNEAKQIEKNQAKGIEKYQEFAREMNDRVTSSNKMNPLKTVETEGMKSQLSIESNESTVSETKSSEKRRGGDQGSLAVAFDTAVKATKNSDGQVNQLNKPRETEKSTLPEVFKKVESMIHHGGGKMTIELTPPELGKIEVDVVTKGQHVEIKVRSDNDFAKVALEGSMGELKTAMEGQNLTLQKVEVQVGLEHGDMSQGGRFAMFSGNEGQSSNQSSRSWNEAEGRSHYRGLTSSAGRMESTMRAESAFASRPAAGGVDIRI